MEKQYFKKFRRMLKYYRKGFRYYFKFAKRHFLVEMSSLTFRTIRPYISLWFSALLLDELLGQRRPEHLVFNAAVIVISNCILTIAQNYMDTRWDAEQYFSRLEELSLAFKKLCGMDYAEVEKPNLQDLYVEVRQNSDRGYNLIGMQWHLACLWQFMLNLSIACWVLSGFVRDSGFPLPYWIAIIAVCIICTLLSAGGSARVEKLWQAYSKKTVPFNRIKNALEDYAVNYQSAHQSSGKNMRIYRSEELLLGNISRWNERLEEEDKNIRLRILGSRIPFQFLSESFSFAVIQIVIALAALAGRISIGSIVKYVACVSSVSEGIRDISYVIISMLANTDYLEAYFRLMEWPNAMHQGTLPVEKRHDNDYVITFDHVSFRYPGTDRDVLKDICLSFRAGEKMAIVGMNGSGKTTFIKLLCRLYDPTEGVILLNGIDIRKYNYEEYLTLFSVVFQDFQILSFSLGENVAADDIMDRERAESALRKAGLEEFLEKLPKGLDTPLYNDFEKEGIQISGGEGQKIALARSIYKKAPFVLLDEPTAALDPVAEFEIYSRFQEIAGDRTTVYISHRLSSCRFCQDIAVFHEGRLVQRGSHDELSAQKDGKYYELWNAQAQYYNF